MCMVYAWYMDVCGNIWISGRRKHEKTPTPVAVAVETKPSHDLPRLDDPTTRDRMTCHFGGTMNSGVSIILIGQAETSGRRSRVLGFSK